MRAASRSFRLLVITGTRSASVIRRSGRAKGSNIPPAACRMRTVPSRCLSFMWFMLTAYMIVPDDGDRIFHIVPPSEWPALNGVMVRPWHFPRTHVMHMKEIIQGMTTYLGGESVESTSKYSSS